ncbi:O-fucosyltransferase family protein [Striga asiatica]|uniref:O-fucosyltransferase family protein n=1 Tax=Striga asiatica TaxID=4170 RepID=A0A5A7NUC8_STRAF|nr:O-fucosyltransferase family protein [Striga asiatica]
MAKDVYRRRNAAKMKKRYNDLTAYDKQTYIDKTNKRRKGQNMGDACLDTDKDMTISKKISLSRDGGLNQMRFEIYDMIVVANTGLMRDMWGALDLFLLT